MIELAPYYYFIYWLVVMMLTVFYFSETYSYGNYNVLFKRFDYKPLIAFSVFFVIVYGLRPISGHYFGDTSNYAATYNLLQTYGTFNDEGVTELSSDWLFDMSMALCAQVMDVNAFFIIVIFLYIALMFYGCWKLDWRHGAILMMACIGAFSFYSYAVNGIRNGLACSIVILALVGVCRGKRLLPIFLSLAAISCHKSTALPLACMFFTYFIRNPKYMYCVWLGAIFLSLIFGEVIVDLISLASYDERLANLTLTLEDIEGNWGVVSERRFRWDFLLYSSMPIILGAYTLFVRKVYNNTYLILLGTYMYANSFWVLVIRDFFSNRYAYLSWFLYPIVLTYPLLNLPVFEKRHTYKTSLILLGHFGFTTIMWMLGKL